MYMALGTSASDSVNESSDFVHMKAKVFVKGNTKGEPLVVTKIVDDQNVQVTDDYGNKKVVKISTLVPAK